MTTLAGDRRAPRGFETRAGRLLVTVQDNTDRSYHPLGFLDCFDHAYRFTYLTRIRERQGFRPLPGIPSQPEGIVSETLFAVFADRIMSPRRPDFPKAMDALGLPVEAAPFEVLARSGRRVGDLLELVEVPQPDDSGRVTLTFLVHGIRYAGEAAARVIDTLQRGDALSLVLDPANKKDPMAVAVEGQRERLGFVPRPLRGVVRDVMDRDHELTVVRANSREAGFHLRLLVTLRGSVSDTPFTGPDWE